VPGTALRLPGAQTCAFFADDRIHPLRQRLDKLIQVRQTQSRSEFIVRGCRSARRRLAPIESWEKKWILDTQAIRLRQASGEISVEGIPLMVNRPASGSIKRNHSAIRVDFPAPLEPTRAICSPAWISSVNPARQRRFRRDRSNREQIKREKRTVRNLHSQVGCSLHLVLCSLRSVH